MCNNNNDDDDDEYDDNANETMRTRQCDRNKKGPGKSMNDAEEERSKAAFIIAFLFS